MYVDSGYPSAAIEPDWVAAEPAGHGRNARPVTRSRSRRIVSMENFSYPAAFLACTVSNVPSRRRERGLGHGGVWLKRQILALSSSDGATRL